MTRAQVEVGSITAVLGTFLTYLLGELDKAFLALLIFIAVDYITGWSAAWYSSKLSSLKGWRGIVKKVMMLALVLVANQIDMVLNLESTTRSLVVFFLLGNEGLSILENLATMGLPMPGFLKEKLEQLKNEKEVKSK